jgi:NitT/TauT family transport system ATP-binding protein
MEPLPQTTTSRIIGVLEMLNDRGGRDDIYKLARELNLELGDLLAAIRATELLEFVTTPGGDVELTELGRKMVRARVSGRKKLFHAQIKKLELFTHVYQMLERAERKRVEKDLVLEELSRVLPEEEAHKLFETVINWSRYAELFGYDQDTGDCFLPEE